MDSKSFSSTVHSEKLDFYAQFATRMSGVDSATFATSNGDLLNELLPLFQITLASHSKITKGSYLNYVGRKG